MPAAWSLPKRLSIRFSFWLLLLRGGHSLPDYSPARWDSGEKPRSFIWAGKNTTSRQQGIKKRNEDADHRRRSSAGKRLRRCCWRSLSFIPPLLQKLMHFLNKKSLHLDCTIVKRTSLNPGPWLSLFFPPFNFLILKSQQKILEPFSTILILIFILALFMRTSFCCWFSLRSNEWQLKRRV